MTSYEIESANDRLSIYKVIFFKSYINLHHSKETSVATREKTPILYSSTDCLFNKEGNQVKIIVLMMEWEYFSERRWISQATN